MAVKFLDEGFGPPDPGQADTLIRTLYEQSDQAFYRLALTSNFYKAGAVGGQLGQASQGTAVGEALGTALSDNSTVKKFPIQGTVEQTYTAFVKSHNKRLSDDQARLIAVTTLQESAKRSVDPRFVLAVIQIESSFNPNDRSGPGAQGLLQLMPVNVRGLGLSDGFDIKQNIYGGVTLLAGHLKKYADKGGGLAAKDTMILGLAGYNAGNGNVRKYGGVPPFKETQNYVVKVPNMYVKFFNELPAAGTPIFHWTPETR